MSETDKVDKITELFLQHAVADGNTDHLIEVIGRIQELLVSMFSLYIIMEGKEHADHDDCDVLRRLPDCIKEFKEQLIGDLEFHIQGNCLANGIPLKMSHNAQVTADILKAMEKE